MNDLLLVPAPSVHLGRLDPYVPCGLLSLQALATQYGEAVDVLSLAAVAPVDRRFSSSDELVETLAEAIEPGRHRVVGLSTMCSSFHHSLGIARLLKARSPQTDVWVGGPHASIAPDLLLDAYPEVDAVFVGEAEAAFEELLRRRQSTGAVSVDGIPGVATRSHPFVPARPVPDLDRLPPLDDAPGFVPAVEAARGNQLGDLPVEAERGCPGRCSFCSTRLFWGRRVRRRSTEGLIAEMRRLWEQVPASGFSLIGDNLAAPHHRLMEFCRRISEAELHLPWYCHLKLDRMTPSDLEVLWTAGCRGFFVGVESGSQRTLDRIGKDVDLVRELEVIHWAIDRGFQVVTSFIVGFPWETVPDLEATYRLHGELLERGVTRSMVSALCPIPGTPVLRQYRADFRPDRGLSSTALDGLPIGPETQRLIGRCPELFSQLGHFRSRAGRVEVAATVQAASTLAAFYGAGRRSPD